MLASGVSGVNGIAGFPWMQPMQPQTIGEDPKAMEARLRKEIMADIDRREYEREKAAFEKEKKEYEADKVSAIGLLVGYVKPYLPLLKEKLAPGLSHVAGTDKPVVAKPIQPIVAEEAEQDEEMLDFTPDPEPGNAEDCEISEEENEKLCDLLKRFRAVEPDYIKLLESVVKMAEAGDATYKMAKNALLQ